MGVNYSQLCIVGISIDMADTKNVVSEAVYDFQPRYNPNTGKETHKEKVLVRSAVEEYSALGIKELGFYDLWESLQKQYPDLHVHLDNDNYCLVVGKSIGSSRDYGNADLLEDEVSIEDVIKTVHELVETLDVEPDDIGIHFCSNVG